MRLVTLSLGMLAVSLLAGHAAPAPVGATTTTPTATPTLAALPVPTGKELLAAAKRAIAATGTGTMKLRQPDTAHWVALSTWTVDLTGTTPRAHWLSRTRPPLTSSGSSHGRYERIILGKREADRSTYGGWVCMYNSMVNADDFSLLQFPGTLTHVTNAGTAVIAGTSVWRVTARFEHVAPAGTEKIRLDIYLDVVTTLPVRQIRHLTILQPGQKTITTHYTMTYAGWGQPVTITMPAGCRGR